MSCTSPQSSISPTSEAAKYREGTLSGERILIPNGINEESFYPTPLKKSDPSARLAASKLSLDELANIAKPIVNKYPDLS